MQFGLSYLTDTSKNTGIVGIDGVLVSELAGFISMEQLQTSEEPNLSYSNNGIVLGASVGVDIVRTNITCATVLSLDNGTDVDLKKLQGSCYGFLTDVMQSTSPNGEKRSFGIGKSFLYYPNAINVVERPTIYGEIIACWNNTLPGVNSKGDVETTFSVFSLIIRKIRLKGD